MRNDFIEYFATILFVVLVCAFRCADNKEKSENEHLKELVLAYQHYYESASFFLSDDGWDAPTDVWPDQVKSLYAAETEIADLLEGKRLPLPEIVGEVMDQRDQLSDVIRLHHDHHLSGCECDIIGDLKAMTDSLVYDKTLMGEWAYSY